MLEHQFVLDGNNKSEMNKIKEYNSLYDDNCRSYFEKIKNKNHLIKQGFIDKNGQIIINPERKNKQNEYKTNKNVNFFQKNVKKLHEIRNKNNITQNLFEKVSSAKEIDSKRELNIENFNKLNKYCVKKDIYLPDINEKNEKKLYHYDRSKEIVLKNFCFSFSRNKNDSFHRIKNYTLLFYSFHFYYSHLKQIGALTYNF
jgi:hypothetical protein